MKWIRYSAEDKGLYNWLFRPMIIKAMFLMTDDDGRFLLWLCPLFGLLCSRSWNDIIPEAISISSIIDITMKDGWALCSLAFISVSVESEDDVKSDRQRRAHDAGILSPGFWSTIVDHDSVPAQYNRRSIINVAEITICFRFPGPA